MTDFTAQARAERAQFSHDPHRPQYHFLPPAHWMNDPNGLIQWEGKFHLFYQHNPNGAYWGTMHWGHAVSDDLVRWTDWPIAMTPTPGGPDESGCFSGCAADDNGVPTLIYTGVRGSQHEIQTQCLATSRDDLRTWDKHPANPVIAGPPRGITVQDFRDPFVWREGSLWYAVLGSTMPGMGGAVLLYRSPDLIHWNFMHPLLVGSADKHGMVWECPNFFRLGNQYVLLVSVVPQAGVYYFVGDYAHHHFVPRREGWLHSSGAFFAPLTMQDDRGRRLMWGWLNEARSLDAQKNAGWAGALSVPMMLNLRADGGLELQPVHELRTLRTATVLQRSDVRVEGEQVLADDAGDGLEIVAHFDASRAQTCGLVLRRSPDGTEYTRVLYDAQAGNLVIDRTHSTLDASQGAACDVLTSPFRLAAHETLTLHIFVDRSVVEVFANKRAYVAARIYPSRADSRGVAVMAQDQARLNTLDVWSMQSIWD